MVVERTVAVMLRGATHSAWGAELLRRGSELEGCRLLIDAAAVIPVEKAELFFSDLVGSEREHLIRMLADTPCHVAVLEGPEIVRRWLELIELCGLSAKTTSMLMHSSTNPYEAEVSAILVA